MKDAIDELVADENIEELGRLARRQSATIHQLQRAVHAGKELVLDLPLDARNTNRELRRRRAAWLDSAEELTGERS